LNFIDRFFENYKNITFQESSPAGAVLFHADRWTDNDEANCRFCNFANAANNK